MWKMLHEKNAIEGAAITVRFLEPLSSMVSKRIIKDLESLAHLEGFIDKQQLQQIQFQVSPQNTDILQTPINGMLFQHNSIGRDIAGNVVPMLSRQLAFQPEQVVMQIQRYRGWEIEWPSALKLLTLAIKAASGVVALAGFRLEYLNRFVFDGAANEGRVGEILKPSDFIAKHVLTAPDLWHSHTGQFDGVTENRRRLTQVNADLQLLNPPHPTAGNRTFALMLAVDQQFALPGLEIDPNDTEEVLNKQFTSLHDDIHDLFKQLIDSKFALENGLPQ